MGLRGHSCSPQGEGGKGQNLTFHHWDRPRPDHKGAGALGGGKFWVIPCVHAQCVIERANYVGEAGLDVLLLRITAALLSSTAPHHLTLHSPRAFKPGTKCGGRPVQGVWGTKSPEAEAILDFYMHNFDLILNYFSKI